MIDIVRGDELVCHSRVSLVIALFKLASDQGFVLFHRHGTSLPSLQGLISNWRYLRIRGSHSRCTACTSIVTAWVAAGATPLSALTVKS